MSGDRIRLEVKDRSQLGSAESRRLRRDGLIPGVLYGQAGSVAISVEERQLRSALTGPSGLHAILDVVLETDGGKTHPSILKEYQQDPIRGTISHVDLQEVRLDRPIQSAVVVHLIGEAAGAKAGGVLQQPAREVQVEALPMEVPEHIDVDVSLLEIGDSFRVGDLAAIERVTFLDDPETVLASVTTPTRVEEPEPEVEEEEGEGVEGEIEGEAPEGAGEPGEAGAEESGGEPEATEE